MANGTDIAEMIRQKNLMDQLQATTGQGTQSALMQPGISQFQDTSTANQVPGLTQHRTSPGILASAAAGAAASGGNVGEAVKGAAANTQMGQMLGLGKPAKPSVAQASPINGVPQQVQPPQPQLIRRDAPMGGATGFQLQIGPDGQPMAVPMSTTPQLQQQTRQYNPGIF